MTCPSPALILPCCRGEDRQAPGARGTFCPSPWLPGAFGSFRKSHLSAGEGPDGLLGTVLLLLAGSSGTNMRLPAAERLLSQVRAEVHPRPSLTQARNIPQPLAPCWEEGKLQQSQMRFLKNHRNHGQSCRKYGGGASNAGHLSFQNHRLVPDN